MDNLNSTTNISANELDEETKEKVKGDTIGDTLYSESFVIKTLMGLSNLKCNEIEENDLCFLWDMTVEKDVCKYLFDLEYPQIAANTIQTCIDDRFNEILIGILANIILAEDCADEKTKIEKNDIKIILKEFNTDNTAILIQLTRLVEGIVYNFSKEYLQNLFDHHQEIEILEKLQFILNYSQSNELIIQTMQTLLRFTDDDHFKLDTKYLNEELINAVIEGFDTIISIENKNFDQDLLLDTEAINKVFKLFFNIITNFCSYINKFSNLDISNAINNSSKLIAAINKIVQYYSIENNLFSIRDDFNEYFQSFHLILTTKEVTIVQENNFNFFKCTFSPLCSILHSLYQCKSEVLDNFNTVLEFIVNLVILVDKDVILNELKLLPYKQRIVILNSLRESSRNFDNDIILEKLRYFFHKFK